MLLSSKMGGIFLILQRFYLTSDTFIICIKRLMFEKAAHTKRNKVRRKSEKN